LCYISLDESPSFLLLIPCLCLSIHLHTLSFLIDSPTQITQIKMATYTKSFSAEDPTNLIRRLIGVGGATVRRVTSGTPRGTKITITETPAGVLCTIQAASIEVARTMVERLKAIATAEPVRSTYVPSSTRRELIGMLIGKGGVILSSIRRKHNVKIFYHGEDGHFSIEGTSSADVHAAHTALHTRDEQAVLKLAGRAAPAVINLDEDVPPPPPSLLLTRHNAVIDLDAPMVDVRDLPSHSPPHPTSPAAAGAGAGGDILDVPPAVVRTVAGETTHTVFVTDEEKARCDRTALIHTICGMFQARGMFTALTPDCSARLIAAAESIADTQLAGHCECDWDYMVAGAEEGVVQSAAANV